MSESIAAQVRVLQRASLAELQMAFRKAFGKNTQQRDREQLWRRLALKLQEDLDDGAVLDQVSPQKSKVMKTEPRQRRARRPLRDKRLPPVGSAITRIYRGHEITVKILDRGFEYEGRVYGSLSAVASKISGCRWNGFLFWGLSKGARR